MLLCRLLPAVSRLSTGLAIRLIPNQSAYTTSKHYQKHQIPSNSNNPPSRLNARIILLLNHQRIQIQLRPRRRTRDEKVQLRPQSINLHLLHRIRLPSLQLRIIRSKCIRSVRRSLHDRRGGSAHDHDIATYRVYLTDFVADGPEAAEEEAVELEEDAGGGREAGAFGV